MIQTRSLRNGNGTGTGIGNGNGIGIRNYRFLHRKTKTQIEIKSLPARKNEIAERNAKAFRTAKGERAGDQEPNSVSMHHKTTMALFCDYAPENEYGPVFGEVYKIDNGKQYNL